MPTRRQRSKKASEAAESEKHFEELMRNTAAATEALTPTAPAVSNQSAAAGTTPIQSGERLAGWFQYNQAFCRKVTTNSGADDETSLLCSFASWSTEVKAAGCFALT
jgi:hypothetical protein